MENTLGQQGVVLGHDRRFVPVRRCDRLRRDAAAQRPDTRLYITPLQHTIDVVCHAVDNHQRIQALTDVRNWGTIPCIGSIQWGISCLVVIRPYLCTLKPVLWER